MSLSRGIFATLQIFEIESEVIYLILKDRDGIERCSLDPENALLSISSYDKLYRVQAMDSDEELLLRMPNSRFLNGRINLEAEHLRALAQESEKIEAKFAGSGNDGYIHYDWLFPQLVDTFITESEQDFRQANLLAIRDARVSDFVPMVKLMDYCKIDAKTAAWILGRFFKLQTFTDQTDIHFSFHVDQVLLEPVYHRMVYLGWQDSDGDDNITLAGKAILDWTISHDIDDEERFIDLLRHFSSMPRGTTGGQAHAELYGFIKKYWGRKYYPFTYYIESDKRWLQSKTSLFFKEG